MSNRISIKNLKLQLNNFLISFSIINIAFHFEFHFFPFRVNSINALVVKIFLNRHQCHLILHRAFLIRDFNIPFLKLFKHTCNRKILIIIDPAVLFITINLFLLKKETFLGSSLLFTLRSLIVFIN